MKISEVAKITNLSVPTLRYYEKIGLVKPERKENDYREYDEADLNWLAFITRAKATGMNLATIKSYSDLREQGDSTIPERIAILTAQEKILQERQEELQSQITFLQEKKRIYHTLMEKHES